MQSKKDIIESLVLSKIKNDIYKLNFAITSACNSNCKTCSVAKIYKNNPEITDKDLKLKEIQKIFKNLPKNLFWLSLSGGEPFLRNDLTEICLLAVKNIPSLSLISIPSNGLAQDKILCDTKKILKTGIKNLFLNFSIDGPEKIHDSIRGIKGAYKTTWKTYKKVLQIAKNDKHLQVNIETTISEYNINYLEKFFKLLVKRGHKITITIAHTGYLYKNSNSSKKFTNLERKIEKIKNIIKIISKNISPLSPLGIIQLIYLKKIVSYYENRQKQPLPCTALKNTIAITSHGDINPCFMWNRKMGNIKNYNFNLNKFLKDEKMSHEEIIGQIHAQTCPNCWTPCEAYQSIIEKIMNLNFL